MTPENFATIINKINSCKESQSQVLDLSNMNLQELTSEQWVEITKACKGYNKLIELKLSDNHLGACFPDTEDAPHLPWEHNNSGKCQSFGEIFSNVLESFPNLQVIHLDGNNLSLSTGPAVTAFSSAISTCKKLQTLNLSRNATTEIAQWINGRYREGGMIAALKYISSPLTELENIDLQSMSMGSLNQSKNNQKKREPQISNIVIDAIIKILPGFKKLKNLYLGDNNLNDEDKRKIQELQTKCINLTINYDSLEPKSIANRQSIKKRLSSFGAVAAFAASYAGSSAAAMLSSRRSSKNNNQLANKEELVVNNQYWYSDEDITHILTARASQEIDLLQMIESGRLIRTDPLAFSIERDPKHAKLMSEFVKIKNIDYKNKIIIIPLNKNGNHWVGLCLNFNNNKAIYVNSIPNAADDNGENIIYQILKILFPNLIFEQKTYLLQKDGSSCGPFLIENMLYAAKNEQRTFYETNSEAIRLNHLLCLKDYDPAFFNSFYNTQKNNINTKYIAAPTHLDPKSQADWESYAQTYFRVEENSNAASINKKDDYFDDEFVSFLDGIADDDNVTLQDPSFQSNKRIKTIPGTPEFYNTLYKQGIDDKYIESVPSIRHAGRGNPKFSHDSKYSFISFGNDLVNDRKIGTNIEIKDNNLDCNLDFHSSISGRKPYHVFVFAGRKEGALFPKPSEHCRVILVATSEEYARYAKMVPKDVDVLVINKIHSAHNGNYKDNLGSINVRRLAAFLFSDELKLENALFLDDNIQQYVFQKNQIPASRSAEVEIHDLYIFMLNQRKDHDDPIIMGAATISPVMKEYNYDSKFCAKSHLWDLKYLRSIGLTKHNLCYLFFKEKDINFVAGDYFFHFFICELIRQASLHPNFAHLPKRRAFATISPEFYGLQRSPHAKNAFSSSAKVKTINEKLDYENSYTPADMGLIETMFLSCQTMAARQLNNCYQFNIERNETKLKSIKTLNLFDFHAKRNGVDYENIESSNVQPVTSDNFNDQFFKKLEENLNIFGEEILLRHQINAIKSIINSKDSGALIMATGSGKTRVQIFLALTALELNLDKPIVIVTPTKYLVEQFYKDLIVALDIFNKNLLDIIEPWQILKISSSDQSISADVLKSNAGMHGKKFIAIFCLASYKNILGIKAKKEELEDKNVKTFEEEDIQTSNSKKDTEYKVITDAPLVLFDEYHEYVKVIPLITAKIKPKLIFGLTATAPDDSKALVNKLFNYNLSDALNDGIIVPAQLNKLDQDYSMDNVKNTKFPEEVYNLLNNTVHPNGQHLLKRKVVIYLPNIKAVRDVAHYLKQRQVTNCFEIHSDERDANINFEKFKNIGSGIAITCEMIGIGVSIKNLDTILYFRNVNNVNDFIQAFGRGVRKDQANPSKIALILAPRNMSTSNIEVNSFFKDSELIIATSQSRDIIEFVDALSPTLLFSPHQTNSPAHAIFDTSLQSVLINNSSAGALLGSPFTSNTPFASRTPLVSGTPLANSTPLVSGAPLGSDDIDFTALTLGEEEEEFVPSVNNPTHGALQRFTRN